MVYPAMLSVETFPTPTLVRSAVPYGSALLPDPLPVSFTNFITPTRPCEHVIYCSEYGIMLVFLCTMLRFFSAKFTKIAQICTKLFVGWGFAPDPTGEAYSANQTT